MTDEQINPQDEGGDDADERVEQLTAEIDETRGDLTETIAAIGEKLEPANIAREATETVKASTLGKVDQMTTGAQETWRDVKAGNTGGIVETITKNPVPAGMVAVGLGMLFMQRGKQSQNQYRPYADTRSSGQSASWEPQSWERRNGGGSPLDAVGSTVSGAASAAGDTVGNVADQAGRKAGEVADTVGQTAGEFGQQAGNLVQQGTTGARRFIDENPLGAGVVALATGAALGLLVPTTRVERETIGEARNQVVEQAESTVHQALDKVDEAVQA